MKRQKQLVTLKDIAKETGFSVNTVSRALRGKSDIGESTTEKIREAAKAMGYINNTIASSLRLGYTNTIAVILGDISNAHFAIWMKEIEIHARELGYTTFLLNTNEDTKQERQAIEAAINKHVDGIIICPVQQDDSNIRFLQEGSVPFIQIGRYFEHLEADYVVCDDVKGGYLAAKYLIEKGHERILMLNGPAYISSARERQMGYEKALREQGLPVIPELIREVSVVHGDCEQVLDQVLKEKQKFTAVFAFSDMLAWEAWEYLEKRGYRVPADISLMGFDHIQSRLSFPFPLSTVSSYKGQVSSLAVQHLHEMIRGERRQQCREKIETSLVTGVTVQEAAAD